MTDGVKIVVSHIDSPRIDLKQNPLYEEADMALLRTHYYGGIKKYQWVTIPLALHGIVVRADGSPLRCIGEDSNDPVFVINDLLPHLSGRTQDQKKISEAIEGEKLTVLAGSLPFPDAEAKERVKLRLMELLHQKYGLVEEDFTSAELELVPAMKARDVGFDRSLIGAYGQDDRASAYTSLQGLLALPAPPHRHRLVCGQRGNRQRWKYGRQVLIPRKHSPSPPRTSGDAGCGWAGEGDSIPVPSDLCRRGIGLGPQLSGSS